MSLTGLAEVGLGLLLISPADEIAIGGTLAPVQGPVTAIIGAYLVYDGLQR